MKVKVLGSNSFGNCYILEANNGTLILELGVPIMEIKKGLDFDLSKVVGALVTHEHGDHSKSIVDMMKLGINVYSGAKTFEAMQVQSPRAKILKAHTMKTIGPFKIFPFDVIHDAAEPLGFIINHEESGNILFITDTAYLTYKFQNINQIFIEANYCDEIIDGRAHSMHPKVLNRTRRSHMSIKSCLDILSVNDLSNVANIVLIHLSDGNSDEKRFISDVKKQTGKHVYAAVKGMELGMNKIPF